MVEQPKTKFGKPKVLKSITTNLVITRKISGISEQIISGSLDITCEVIKTIDPRLKNKTIEFQFGASILTTTVNNMDLFLVISQVDNKMIVHTTDSIKGNLNPKWSNFAIESTRLCFGDINRKLQFEIYNRADVLATLVVCSFLL